MKDLAQLELTAKQAIHDPHAAAEVESGYAGHFLAAVVSGDQQAWTNLEASLKRAAALRPRSPADIATVIRLLLQLTEYMRAQRRADVRQVLASREHAARLLEFVARHEAEGKGAMAFAELQRALEFNTMQNLSMLLGYLDDNEIVERSKQGRNTWVALTAMGRHYARQQGWIETKPVQLPRQQFSKTSVAVKRGDL